MNRQRRVGTLTLGTTLLAAGLAFGVGALYPQGISYGKILSFWPLILIGLGVEILLSQCSLKKDPMIYDMGGVLLLVLMGLFSVGMAAAQMILTNPEVWSGCL